jgi:hypothetical protein
VDIGGLGREWTAARLAIVPKVHVGGHRHRNLWFVGVPQGDGHRGVGEGGEHSSMNRPLTWAPNGIAQLHGKDRGWGQANDLKVSAC